MRIFSILVIQGAFPRTLRAGAPLGSRSTPCQIFAFRFYHNIRKNTNPNPAEGPARAAVSAASNGSRRTAPVHQSRRVRGAGRKNYVFRFQYFFSTWAKYVTTDDAVVVYWAYPEGTDENTEFHLVHYVGLDRNSNTDLGTGQYTTFSLGAGIQVEQAALMKKAGASDEEILKFLRSFTDRVAVYFAVDDLMHLKRGGRLSGFAAVAGTMLGLKPVLTFNEEGGLSVLTKQSGRRKAISYLAGKVIEELRDEDTYPVYVVDADCPEDGDRLRDLILEKRPRANVIRQIVGPVIGAHCGPGTLGVIFVADRRPIPLKKD